MSIINLYSFPIFTGVLLLAALLVIILRGRRRNELLTLAGVTAILLVAWVAARPTGSNISAAQAADAAIGQGLPVLIEAQSPY